MLRFIILVTLLVSSVCALQWKIYREELIGNEESSGEVMVKTNQGLPGVCWACKWAMRNVKKKISNGATQDDIKSQLAMVCDQMGFLKSLCRSMVSKYTGVLVEELSTSDDPTTICVNVGICKKRPL
ncbi:antimicrobial peptide NK-lysin-like isoform X2 [Paramisgurnus dabryanus]|uniref:antimicrobial peptide NK-lysin-like isoform X2 n=1 Tax=Paramisgurnus dabryanus TaxID=90735 RepID=UPI0031F41DBA